MPIPYASVTDLAKYADSRMLARLGSDTDADGTVSDANAILAGALERASYEVRTYALRGGQYSSADLDSLQSAGDKTLVGLVCDIAVAILLARRMREVPEAMRMQLARANDTLAALRDGKVIFTGSTDIAGTKADAAQATIGIVSASQRGSMRMASDQPFFPPRRTVAY
jgi:hypothetical protein